MKWAMPLTVLPRQSSALILLFLHSFNVLLALLMFLDGGTAFDYRAWFFLYSAFVFACSLIIIANSTFSWWGAWLAASGDKTVITPDIKQEVIQETNWGFEGLIPDQWVRI